MKKRFCSALLVLCIVLALLPFGALAVDTITVGPLTFALKDGEATVVSCDTEAAGELVSPEIVDGDPVTAIGHSAFEAAEQITAVTIPDSVTLIRENAFHRAYSLATVVLPKNLKEIPARAFYQCSNLKDINFPEGLERIGDSAFADCYDLGQLELPGSVRSLGAGAFAGCGRDTNRLVLPEGITEIGNSCFADSFYRVIVLPSTLETLGKNVFASFRGWKVDLSATKIEVLSEGMFNDGFASEILLPDTLRKIEYQAFYRSHGLESITLPEGVLSIGDRAFAGCEDLKSIDVPDSVTEIGEEAFSNCVKLEAFSFPRNLKEIGMSAFDNCRSLKYAVLPIGLTAIPTYMFRSCSGLEAVFIPDSVRTIGGCAFSFCSRLQEVRLPKNLSTVPAECFRGCSSLVRVWMTNSVMSIDATAFDECDAMQELYFYGTEEQLRSRLRLDYVMPQSGLYHTSAYLINAYPDAYYGFFDMPEETEWSYEGISFCLDNGFMNGMGEGLFQPNGTTTRAQLVTILWRMCEEPAAEKAADFIDTQNHWAKDAISWAAENGIVNGVGESLFAPDAPITREQLVTIFHRFCKEYLEMDVSQTQPLDSFPDSGAVSDWAQDAMQWGVAVKLISGVATQGGAILQPQGSATRAQIAKVILNFFENVYTE